MSDIHMMELVSDCEGTQEWQCPECGRVILVEWNPWRRVVVVPGEDAMPHAGLYMDQFLFNLEE